MDDRYEFYCLADPVFYDAPPASPESDFASAGYPLPDRWERSELGPWLVYRPSGARLPQQGWKIHVSACLDNAEDILEKVWSYCVKAGIAFKFLRNEQALLFQNAKSADRGSSGKFITIYPVDDSQFEQVLGELGTILEGYAGPYILSDLRYAEGPLYVRYGGFFLRRSAGNATPVIESDSGELIADRRGPTFQIPAWVSPPTCLKSHLDRRNQKTIDGFPFHIKQALHFSNGGGVYLGIDRQTDGKVLLKEARPHAGVSLDRADAVSRLRHEREILTKLRGLSCVPAVRDYFVFDEHHFLVEDFIEGQTLNSMFIARYPLVRGDPKRQELGRYTTWVIETCSRVEAAVDAIHGRGVVISDLHPSNILVGSNGEVTFVDFEAAFMDAENQRPFVVGTPSFSAPHGVKGFDVDRYALASLRLFLFLPLTALLRLEPRKVSDLCSEILDEFPAAEEFVTDAKRVVAGATMTSPSKRRNGSEVRHSLGVDLSDWERSRSALAHAILGSATPNRDDRLFPGDIEQFTPLGGLSFAYGAAGVLYALDAVDADWPSTHAEWLIQRTKQWHATAPLGFYNGLHGVAYVLQHLGHQAEALALLGICVERLAGSRQEYGSDLMGGLAGIGLNLVHFAQATGDASLWDAASSIVEHIVAQLGDENSVGTVSGGGHFHAGLLRGSSGPALLFLRMHEKTGDERLLDFAATALRQDLRRCITGRDGSLQVNEGWRTLPYLRDGSIGIGLVLRKYLACRVDEGFAGAAAAIHRAAESQFYIYSGLFSGRAGMILYLSQARNEVDSGSVLERQIERLRWHAIRHKDEVAFPGDQLLRLSMDLATGTAGVLLALGAALHDRPVTLPFLSREAARRSMASC